MNLKVITGDVSGEGIVEGIWNRPVHTRTKLTFPHLQGSAHQPSVSFGFVSIVPVLKFEVFETLPTAGFTECPGRSWASNDKGYFSFSVDKPRKGHFWVPGDSRHSRRVAPSPSMQGPGCCYPSSSPLEGVSGPACLGLCMALGSSLLTPGSHSLTSTTWKEAG